MKHIYLVPRFFFFFNDTATTEIYTLSLHDALPISAADSATDNISSSTRKTITRSPISSSTFSKDSGSKRIASRRVRERCEDRKSTRLNSSHTVISYAVFCLKKKTSHTGHTNWLSL